MWEFHEPGVLARGEGGAIAGNAWRNALLHNGHGRYGEALVAAREACEHEDVLAFGRGLVELIEAGVRSGGADEAAAAVERLSEQTRASGTAWALGIEARCRALVSDDETRYRESIDLLGRSRAAVDLARSRLVYGEWLRRANRRAEAREVLRRAHAEFSRFGAAGVAREGHTNPEIGAQLFISPRTVEYHLRKVFRKLDVTTRRELRDALAGQFA